MAQSGLLKTLYLSRVSVLKGEKPVSGSSVNASDCLSRELILVTGKAGSQHGVPDGLYVYNALKSRSTEPDNVDPVTFVSDTDVVNFILQTANFSLVNQRCSAVPGTMYADTPKAARKPPVVSYLPEWSMVDFIPLFFIVNMESENERAVRLSRVAREASAWDAAMRDYRDKYKPKMSIPQTPAARSIGGTSASGGYAGGPFSSCISREPDDQNERSLPALKFTSDAAIACEGGHKSTVNAARFFITFQHPEEIKSETPSLLSLILIGHTEVVDAAACPKKRHMATAKELLSMELLLLRAVYAGAVRNPDDVFEAEYERDGRLVLAVQVPKWRIVAFVSPPSGKGEAIPTWTVTILPVLYCGRFSTLGILTTRRGHAEDVVADSAPGEGKKGHVFTNHDILVSVGGDGVAHEICNGIARRNRFEALPMQRHARGDPRPQISGAVSTQAKRDAEDPEQQAARKHEAEIWADVPMEDPTGFYEVPDEILAQTPYIALVAAGSGCALAKEVEVENFIVCALTLLHIRPVSLDCYRMDPFDIPESTIRATNARYLTSDAEKSTIKLRNAIEGSALFSKASETPVRFGMLALMFAAVNEVDKGSESMRWMGNTRFAVKTLTMLVSGVPLYRVYLRYSSDYYYMPEVKAPVINQQFSRSYAPVEGEASGCSDWVITPCFRVSFMSLNNIRLVARDICFAPYARPSNGFIDTLFVGASEFDSSSENYKLKIRRRDAVDFFGKTETGAHVNDNVCSYGKCRRIQVMPIDGNVMADGEVMNKTGITVSCVRRALIVLASPAMNWEN